MKTSTTLPAPPLFLYVDTYATEHVGTPAYAAARRAQGQALAYAWGAADYSPPSHPYVSSTEFSDAYGLATFLGDGYVPMPLQDAYVTWAQTGRLVIRTAGMISPGSILVSVHSEDGHILCRHIPHAGTPFSADDYRIRFVHPHAQPVTL